MENNPNNTSAQSGAQNQNRSSNTPGSSAGSTSAQSNNTASSSNSASSTGSANNLNAQGKSNQQGTSGKDSMKNIQDMLQKYSGPITQKINSLTTTQKVVGGSLLALGAGWLAMSSTNKNKIKSKAGAFKSTAKEKISSKKKDKNSTNATNYSSSANRTGSSAVDARVK